MVIFNKISFRWIGDCCKPTKWNLDENTKTNLSLKKPSAKCQILFWPQWCNGSRSVLLKKWCLCQSLAWSNANLYIKDVSWSLYIFVIFFRIFVKILMLSFMKMILEPIIEPIVNRVSYHWFWQWLGACLVMSIFLNWYGITDKWNFSNHL